MSKFLDETGLSQFWEKIKLRFLERSETAVISVLDIDNTPTSNSTNLVTSGGVKAALDNKANKNEMSVVAGTGANADKTTITLKNDTNATVLTSHQDISGKADKATTLAGYGITDAKITNGTITLGNNTITPVTAVDDGSISNGRITINKANNNGQYGLTTLTDTVENVSNKALTPAALYSFGLSVSQALNGKLDTLVSGTNIKTVNNESLLGSGNISISTELSSQYAPATTSSAPASGDTYETAVSKLHKVIVDNEEITSISLNELNNRLENYNGNVVHKASEETISGDKTFTGSVNLGSNATATTPADGDNDTSVATTAFVQNAVNALPTPMLFKGSLGTGGTYTGSSFPPAANTNKGWTVKVITDGTYQGVTAKVGDTLISDGTNWILIPSGDEPSGTVTSIQILSESPISIDLTDAITSNGVRTITHNNSGITAGTYKSVTVDAKGHVTAGTNPTTLAGYGITDAINTSSTAQTKAGNLTAAKFITSGGTANQVVLGTGNLATAKELPQYEAYLEWGGKNFAAAYGPIDAAMVDELGAPRTMFAKAASIVVEYSTDGGNTWLDYGATDVQKVGLFSSSQIFYTGKNSTAGGGSANNMLRVSLRTGVAPIYTTLNKFVIYVGTNGSTGCYCTIRCRTQQNYEDNVDTWVTRADQVPINGWSGYNVINITSTTTYGNMKSTQYGEWQFIFGCTNFSGNYTGLCVNKIIGFGGVGWVTPSNMAKTGHIYAFDASQNATFPAKVQAASFKKSGGTSSQFLKADGSVDSTAYLTSSSLSDYVKHSNEQVSSDSSSCSYSAESIDSYNIYTTGPYQKTVANGEKIVVDSLDTATIYLIDATDYSDKKVIALDASGDISWTNWTGSPVVVQFGSSVQNTNISVVKYNVGYDEEVEYLEDMVGVEVFELDGSLLNWTENTTDDYYATYQSDYDQGELYQAMLNSIKLNKEVKLCHNNAFIPYLGYDSGAIHYCTSLVSHGTLAEIHYWVNSDGTLIREEFIIQESDLGSAITKANSAVLNVTITQSSSTNAGTTIQVDNGTTYTIVSDTEPQGSDRAYKAPSWGAMENKMDENELVVSAALNDLNTRINDLNDEKQDTLVSGTDIKTINNQSILGSGNIDITSDLGDSLVAMFSKLDEITPVRTIEYDIASTTGQIIFSRPNVTEDALLNTVTDTLIYSIEVTGNSDSNIYAQYKVYAHFLPCPTRSPMTFIEHIHKNPAGTASLEGLKLLTYYYPKAVNNGYPYICYITAPAAGSRHIKIRVYLDSSNVSWKNPAIPVAVTEGLYNTTYLTKGSEMTITASGWITNGITQAATTTATVSTSLPKNFTANIFLAGEALTGGNLVYRALNDGKIYRVGTLTATINDVSTNLTLDPMFGVTRIINSRAINANIPASDLDYKRSINPSTPNNGSSFQIETGWVKGDTMYYKCTLSGSSLIPTGHITSTLSPSYAYFPIGVINTASSMDFDCIGHEFVTLNASGKVTHVNGLEIAGGSGGGGSQDLSDYVKYSNTTSSTDPNGSCSSSETVEDNAIYTSGSTHYIINPGYTISLDVLSDAYTTYVINNTSPKAILASGTGDIEWTNTTSSNVDVLVGSGTSGLNYTATIYLKGYTEEVGEIKEKLESISLFEIVTVYGTYYGDANEDNYVNTSDVSHISLNLGSTDPKYDANNDGTTTIGDSTYAVNIALGKDLPYINVSTNPYTDLYNIYLNGKIPVLKIVIGQNNFYVVMNHDILGSGASHFSGRFFTYIKTGYYYISCGSSYFTITPIKNATYEEVLAKQDKLVSGTNIKTINGESILGSGNITIQGGSGGGDTNIIETVKVNGTALTPDSNKAVNITSIPSSIVTQDATHRFVSDTEKSTWNGKLNALQHYSEPDDDAQIIVEADPDGTGSGSHGAITLLCLNELSYSPIAELEISIDRIKLYHEYFDTGVHSATSSEYIELRNGGIKLNQMVDNVEQNVILDTTGFKFNNKQIATTDLIPTESTVSGWGFTKNTGTITGVSVNNTSVATSGVANITVPVYLDDLLGSSSSIHVSQDAFDAKASKATTLAGYGITDAKIANGVITLGSNTITPLTSHLSIKTINNNTITGTGNVTIATPGILKSDNTTAQTTANNESLSGTVNLHKISKTGNYNDLIDKPTIPAAVTESTVSGWGFTKNAGTITGVTGSNGLTGSGSSGSVTISHAAPSTSPAKSTSAVYPITIDKYGHITAAGTAVTIPTQVTELTVSGWGFTKNVGTVTSVEVNGTTASLDAGGCISIDAITGIEYASHPITATNGVVDILTAILTEINAAKVTIYSGTAAPSNSLGTNGDLYLLTS